MGKRWNLRGWLRVNRPSKMAVVPRDDAPPTLDTDLIIRAARLVVTTRAATRDVLVRQLSVSEDAADAILVRLEHCKVIAPLEIGKGRRVLTTSGQLPGVIAEFRERGDS